jgi:SAM-dependent methyltransferase
MRTSETTPCLVCGANNYEIYSKKGQFGLPVPVVICKDCGFSYLNPRWTKERYDEFYRKEYDHYYRPEVIGQNDERHRYQSIKHIISRLSERSYPTSFSDVLDIGSGMGHSLIYLRNKDLVTGKTEAIEPSENCIAYMTANGIHQISSDVYADWEKAKVLQKAREVLRENGLLYVAVPDAMHPTKPLKSHFFRIVHISYFTKHSLTNLLKKSGLEVLEIVEGDQYEKSEVFAICKRGTTAPVEIRADEFDKQKQVYNQIGRRDGYYQAKSKLISFLRRMRILN